jgi:hypothetical protein
MTNFKKAEPICAGELVTRSFPDIPYFMKPLLSPGSLGMVHAGTGVGKTFFCFWLAAAASAGGSFLRWNADRRARVLYIDGEMGIPAMHRRLLQVYKFGGWDIPEKGLMLFSPDNFRSHCVADIGSKDGQAFYEESIALADLIFIDNLSTCARRLGNESEESAWARVQRWLISLRARKKAVVIVHHSGKSGAQLGTSAREHILDWTINLKRPADYDPSEGARFDVHFEKHRDFTGEDSEPMCVTFKADETSVRWEWRNYRESISQNIHEMKRAGMSAPQIAESVHRSLFFVKKILKEIDLPPAGYITQEQAEEALF